MVVHPAFILFLGAVLIALLPVRRKRLRAYVAVLVPVLALLTVVALPDQSSWLYINKLSRLFAFIMTLISAVAGVYAFHNANKTEQITSLLYAAGSLGVIFSTNYIVLYTSWELMVLSSVFLVWAGDRPGAQAAAWRYLYFHLFGGALLLAGIILLSIQNGFDFSIGRIYPDASTPAAWLILLGVLVNTAAPPLHAWLKDAYPKASVTGAVFLSALTTKTALYVLIRVFPSWDILIWLGSAMAVYGVVYAMMVSDIRSILAYHIISQVGFMICAVGIGTELALNGAVAHAFCHILYKALLFMGCGAVLYSTGQSSLSSLGGLYRAMPKTFFLYMIGALSISGVPLFNGFISKSMTIAAAHKAHYDIAFFMLAFASIGTFLSTALKLPYFTWFSNDRGWQITRAVPKNMFWAMSICAGLCIIIGVWPDTLYAFLPFNVEYHPYTLAHLVESLQTLAFAGLAFYWLKTKLAPTTHSTVIDVDYLYRKPSTLFYSVFVRFPRFIFSGLEVLMHRLLSSVVGYIRMPHFSLSNAVSWILLTFILLYLFSN